MLNFKRYNLQLTGPLRKQVLLLLILNNFPGHAGSFESDKTINLDQMEQIAGRGLQVTNNILMLFQRPLLSWSANIFNTVRMATGDVNV